MSTTTEDTAFSVDVKEEESNGINLEDDTRVAGNTYTKGLTDTFIGYGGEVNPDIE